MAIGITPKHIEEYLLNDLTKEQFTILAIETALKMSLRVTYVSVNGLVAYTDKGVFSYNGMLTIKFGDGIATIQSESTGSEMVDMGRNKKLVNDFIENLEELKPLVAKEELDAQYDLIREKVVSDEEDTLKLPPATAADKARDFLSFFKPVEGYFVTPVLLIINILIFVLMLIGGANIMSPSSETLLNWGANFRPMTLDGQWWRIITSCFIHIGVFHLVMNMYALMYIGVLLEPHLGKTRFIAAYLLTGIVSSMASLWWHDFTVSAGASGAIFGMYGVFLALLTTNLIEKAERNNLLSSIGIFVVFNLFYGMTGGIDNAAHIGGLIGGIIIGYALIPGVKKPYNNALKFGSVALLTVLVLGASFVVYTKMPNDIGRYEAEMQKFSAMEERALKVYKMPDNTSKEKYLEEINGVGIPMWKEIIRMLDNFETMNLPATIEKRNQILREYAGLRIKSYEVLAKSFSDNTGQYDAEIQNYNKLITEKIGELNKEKE